MHFKSIMPHERSQTQKVTYTMTPFILTFLQRQNSRDKKQISREEERRWPKPGRKEIWGWWTAVPYHNSVGSYPIACIYQNSELYAKKEWIWLHFYLNFENNKQKSTISIKGEIEQKYLVRNLGASCWLINLFSLETLYVNGLWSGFSLLDLTKKF